MAKAVLILAFFSLVIAAPGKPSLDIFRDVNGTDVLGTPIGTVVLVRIGNNLTLSCVIANVENDLDNQIVWSRNASDSNFQNELGKSEPSKLYFSRIARENEGIYVCASTKYNITKAVFILVLPTKPETVADPAWLSSSTAIGLDAQIKLKSDLAHQLVDDLFKVPSDIDLNNIRQTYHVVERPAYIFKPKSNWMPYCFAVMGGLTLLFGLLKYALSKPNSGRGNQPLAACDHRMCNRNRRNNPSAGCLMVLTTSGDEVPESISVRVEGVTVLSSFIAAADATDSREMNQLDLPLSYNSSTVRESNNVEPSAPQSDLLPSYDAVI